MKCVICREGQTASGQATVTLQRGESTIIFKNVPAQVCSNCGEYYLSESVTNQLLTRAEAAVQSGAELEILRFAA
ncbi:MAG: type II toxin-antitoxin system MqsA family antitoxin [Deltaproteobacteria bacterium]|nr:type II toxin-antitoxin system MqsA family antitoxin [Deltaproteobacteria bacterium]